MLLPVDLLHYLGLCFKDFFLFIFRQTSKPFRPYFLGQVFKCFQIKLQSILSQWIWLEVLKNIRRGSSALFKLYIQTANVLVLCGRVKSHFCFNWPFQVEFPQRHPIRAQLSIFEGNQLGSHKFDQKFVRRFSKVQIEAATTFLVVEVNNRGTSESLIGWVVGHFNLLFLVKPNVDVGGALVKWTCKLESSHVYKQVKSLFLGITHL